MPPLEEPSDPTKTPNPSKAPWYFLALQEMLVYFDPWIAGVVLPGLIIAGLIAIPYIDINPKGKGYYTIKERPFALAVFCFGFIILWIVLMVVGTFLRGPRMELLRALGEVGSAPCCSIDEREFVVFVRYPRCAHLRTFSGFFVVAGYFAIGPIFYLWKRKSSHFLQELGLVRYIVVSFLFLTMLALPIKMVLRVVLNVKYIWVSPWFNI